LICPTDHRRILLIDFGLARQYCGQPAPVVGPGREPDYLFGTLFYASLHAHRGIALARRDDLESLAYILFEILRGRLSCMFTQASSCQFFVKSKLGPVRCWQKAMMLYSGSFTTKYVGLD
ncbi:hypothetical protein DFH29DRAFT_811693, partial [Suillus ampliporus]